MTGYFIKYPWLKAFYNARDRCNNKKYKCYKNYGGRGIKFNMIKDDFKHLWYRDKAEFMRVPSIDRIDNNGDYTIDNCRYIERHLNNSTRMPVKRIKNGKVDIFAGIQIAAKATRILAGSISNVIHNKARTAGGYKWERV